MLAELEGLEDWIGAGDGAEEVRRVHFLSVEGWVGGGEGAVFCMTDYKFLSYIKIKCQ